MTVLWLTAFLDVPGSTFQEESAFWQGLTGYSPSPRHETDVPVSLIPECGDGFLTLRSVSQGPPACRIQLHVDEPTVAVELAVQLGASVMGDQPGGVLLASPSGLNFSVVEQCDDRDRPPPALWPGGHRSLVDQVCLDIPPDTYDRECAFWSSITGWERRTGTREEFQHLVRPARIPLRLLLQRLDDEQAVCTRAHLDLACEDMLAEARRHETYGAVLVRSMDGWTTMQDPSGLHYCITRRDPNIGSSRHR